MKKLLTSTVLAAVIAVVGSASFAEERMSDIWLEEPAPVSNAFAYYKHKAPNASFQRFLEDNPQLGQVSLETYLPVGTIFYVPTYRREDA